MGILPGPTYRRTRALTATPACDTSAETTAKGYAAFADEAADLLGLSRGSLETDDTVWGALVDSRATALACADFLAARQQHPALVGALRDLVKRIDLVARPEDAGLSAATLSVEGGISGSRREVPPQRHRRRSSP